MIVTSYLWSRAEAIKAARLAADPRIGDEFATWVTEQQVTIFRNWDETLDAALPQIRGHAGERDIEIQDAAQRLSDATGRKVTRTELFELMHMIGWIVRPQTGNGWRPTLEARAREVVYSRSVKLPGKAGFYEQCFLTEHGCHTLEQYLRDALQEMTHENNEEIDQ